MLLLPLRIFLTDSSATYLKPSAGGQKLWTPSWIVSCCLRAYGLLVTGELPLWIPLFFFFFRHWTRCLSDLRRIDYPSFCRRPIDVVYIGKIATACLMTGFSFYCWVRPWWTVWVLYVFGFRFSPANRVVLVFSLCIGILFFAATAVVYTVQAARIICSRGR